MLMPREARAPERNARRPGVFSMLSGLVTAISTRPRVTETMCSGLSFRVTRDTESSSTMITVPWETWISRHSLFSSRSTFPCGSGCGSARTASARRPWRRYRPPRPRRPRGPRLTAHDRYRTPHEGRARPGGAPGGRRDRNRGRVERRAPAPARGAPPARGHGGYGLNAEAAPQRPRAIPLLRGITERLDELLGWINL